MEVSNLSCVVVIVGGVIFVITHCCQEFLAVGFQLVSALRNIQGICGLFGVSAHVSPVLVSF